MRFFHIADVHLGAEPDKGCPWSRNRSREIWNSFQKVIEQAGREHADLFLIAGDLFHRQPRVKELKEVNAMFSAVPDMKILLIAGNHDYLKRDSLYPRFPWAPNVRGLWSREITHVDFPDLGLRVTGCSYTDRENVMPVYDNLRKSGDMPLEILLAHGGDKKHIPISRERLAAAGFDYVALGHIHKPQALVPDRMVYAGALEPTDRNDTGPHGFVKGEIRGNAVRTVFVPQAVREYKERTLFVTRKTTQYTLVQAAQTLLEKEGQEHMYTLTLQGERSPEVEFQTEPLYGLGNILEVEDQTRPGWSPEELCRKYRGSLLEEYIRGFGEEPGEAEKKAMDYGIGALLETGEEMP